MRIIFFKEKKKTYAYILLLAPLLCADLYKGGLAD